MQESLTQRLSRPPPGGEIADPWADGVGYVVNFRRHLEVIASALSLIQGQVIQTRFNANERCAELHNQSGYVFAQIRVHGDMGTANKALVTPLSLSEDQRMLFVVILPIRVELQAAQKVAA